MFGEGGFEVLAGVECVELLLEVDIVADEVGVLGLSGDVIRDVECSCGLWFVTRCVSVRECRIGRVEWSWEVGGGSM
jgi:hypothetical protein